jgi:succinate dehydrogenase/fumarate reductase flavoprotein subunit
MLGAFVYGRLAGESCARFCADHELASVQSEDVERERRRVWAPLQRERGLPPQQVEYKLRRMVNDYLQPPKVTRKMQLGLERFEGIRDDLQHLHARDPHELMRALEVFAIRDCAEMATRASLFRTESRWGLYHARADFPQRNDTDWLCHVQLQNDGRGRMRCFKRALEPYIVPIGDTERNAYRQLRTPQLERAV